MTRSSTSGIGFGLRAARGASARLTGTVAASLAVASLLSLCLIVAITVLSIKVAVAG
jgi:hypothetical protein